MAGSFQYNNIDATTERLGKIQEYLDLGLSSTLDIALDIEESHAADETSDDIEKLKDLTVQYVQMEIELKQWLKAADLTKTTFREEYRKVTDGSVPDIEEILMSKLNEIESSNSNEQLQQHQKVKEFAQQVWNVHHSGQPLPGAENDNMDEDIVIAQAPEESIICPLTRKQMVQPVRSKKCNHSYGKTAIIQHIRSRPRAKCPVVGCANVVTEKDLEPNSSLAFRIKRLERKQ